MRFAYFTHSLTSCWNHGNAHFLRGVLRELAYLGHAVDAFEPAQGWSRANLVRDHGPEALGEFARNFPELSATCYEAGCDVAALVDGADIIIVHEWTDPAVVAALGRLRRCADFVLLFHDTHHRAVSEPAAIRRFDLSAYDGILAFGEALAEVYRARDWDRHTFVWHEAADTRLFRPPQGEAYRDGLVWIGNWGDGERAAELDMFLLRPAAALGLALDVHGVRYPDPLPAGFRRADVHYRGWLPNTHVPDVFARHAATVHVPRRFYAETLPGIPTIRVFEALACGIPLVCAPWDDCEGLFRPGVDYLLARSGHEMTEHLRAVMQDADLRRSLVENGLATIRARHTCAHRAAELLAIVARLKPALALENA
jgi:spore maturation protein CgeB